MTTLKKTSGMEPAVSTVSSGFGSFACRLRTVNCHGFGDFPPLRDIEHLTFDSGHSAEIRYTYAVYGIRGVQWLQWGRDQMRAQIPKAATGGRPYVSLLQWGRDHMIAEITALKPPTASATTPRTSPSRWRQQRPVLGSMGTSVKRLSTCSVASLS
jgi:hypothetical protein